MTKKIEDATQSETPQLNEKFNGRGAFGYIGHLAVEGAVLAGLNLLGDLTGVREGVDFSLVSGYMLGRTMFDGIGACFDKGRMYDYCFGPKKSE